MRRLLAGVANGVVWSVARGNGPGLETAAVSHGDFDNDPLTLASIKHLLEHGF
jgi:hypothetical protein